MNHDEIHSLDEDEVTDLVGWARGTGLRDPDPATSRQILATALGVDAESLSGLDGPAVTTALGRLRALAERCDRLASAAEVDDLTKTMRRGAGLAALQREADRSRRHPASPLSVLFVDIDRLKEVNDRDGHSAGDQLIVGTVAAIRDRLRSYDLIIRYGGDEFICGLSGVDGAAAEHLAEDIRAAVRATTSSTVSIGIATMDKGESLDSVIKRADHDLYQGRSASPVSARR